MLPVCVVEYVFLYEQNIFQVLHFPACALFRHFPAVLFSVIVFLVRHFQFQVLQIQCLLFGAILFIVIIV